jgi:hypothetical protein
MTKRDLREVMAYLSQQPATNPELQKKFSFRISNSYTRRNLEKEYRLKRKGKPRGYVYYIEGSPAEAKADEKLKEVFGGLEWRPFDKVILEKLAGRPRYRDELLKEVIRSYIKSSTGTTQYKALVTLALEELLFKGKVLETPADHLYASRPAATYIVYCKKDEPEVAKMLDKLVVDAYAWSGMLHKKLPADLKELLRKKINARRRKLHAGWK